MKRLFLSEGRSRANLAAALSVALSALLLAASVLLAHPAHAAQPGGSVASVPTKENLKAALKPYSISYTAYYQGSEVGDASRSLVKSGNRWELTMESKASYLLLSDHTIESSEFILDGNTLKPQHYSRDSKRSFKSRQLRQKFDWQSMTDTGSYKDKNWERKLPDNALDQLSQLIVIRALLLDSSTANKPLPELTISYRGKTRRHQFTMVGAETIETAQGSIKARKVTMDEVGRDRQTIFWLAEQRNLVPVQIVRAEGGEEEVRLTLSDW